MSVEEEEEKRLTATMLKKMERGKKKAGWGGARSPSPSRMSPCPCV